MKRRIVKHPFGKECTENSMLKEACLGNKLSKTCEMGVIPAGCSAQGEAAVILPGGIEAGRNGKDRVARAGRGVLLSEGSVRALKDAVQHPVRHRTA